MEKKTNPHDRNDDDTLRPPLNQTANLSPGSIPNIKHLRPSTGVLPLDPAGEGLSAPRPHGTDPVASFRGEARGVCGPPRIVKLKVLHYL